MIHVLIYCEMCVELSVQSLPQLFVVYFFFTIDNCILMLYHVQVVLNSDYFYTVGQFDLILISSYL